MKEMRAFVGLTVLFFIALGPSSVAQNNGPNGSEISLLERFNYETVSTGYSFILGQDMMLDEIETHYPELATEVRNVRNALNAAYGNARRVAEKQMKMHLGENFMPFRVELESQALPIVAEQTSTRDQVKAVLEAYRKRAKGEIESPFLEVLLALQYSNAPPKEFTSGFKQLYSTENHPKAKGIHVSINFPKSWIHEEADRPNIVAKFTSRLGTGHGTIQIGVRDMGFPPGIKLSKEELAEILSEDIIGQMIPGGMEKVSARQIKLDNLPAGEVICEGWGSMVGHSIYTKMYNIFVIHEGKMIVVQCAVADVVSDGVKEAFESNKWLFTLVASSIVLHSQWR